MDLLITMESQCETPIREKLMFLISYNRVLLMYVSHY